LAPYGALAGELILCNKAVNQCGGLAQAFHHSGSAEREPRIQNSVWNWIPGSREDARPGMTA
jgi:hypothetical protein